MIDRITEGLSSTQVRVIRVRLLFLCLKAFTDFLTTAGTAFTAGVAQAKDMPSGLVIIIAIIGGLVAASKNLGDALSAALPPPVIAAPPPSATHP